MLEGQVAALSAGAITPTDSRCDVLEALFDSDVYRPDQHSFMLYPDRGLTGVPREEPDSGRANVDAIPLLRQMLIKGDERIIVRDADGQLPLQRRLRQRRRLEVRNSTSCQANMATTLQWHVNRCAAL